MNVNVNVKRKDLFECCWVGMSALLWFGTNRFLIVLFVKNMRTMKESGDGMMIPNVVAR